MPELWQAILVDAIVRPLSETSYRLRGDLIGVAPFFLVAGRQGSPAPPRGGRCARMETAARWSHQRG